MSDPAKPLPASKEEAPMPPPAEGLDRPDERKEGGPDVGRAPGKDERKSIDQGKTPPSP